ncbi:MAG: helix-turn-helix domain-containing protein [Desulfurivibrionaceae bacterium]|jgi:lambda repressor-like predicted transcriptional regulator
MKPHEIRAAMVLAQTKIKDIAEQCGHHPPAVHQVINNERPNPRIRAAIAEAIGKPVEEIWPVQKSEEQAA